MLDAAINGITQLFNLSTIGWMLIGVMGGLIIGVIPGIGSVSMLSVLVPFTLVLDSNTAFALMIGFISVACTGDAIPAILLGIPGSASSQATVIDGYAMAKKGEAARALGASFTASCLGGLFGALILTLVIQIIRPVVLIFGAPEFLLLALWGVSMVAVLSGRSPLKGLAVGGIGLLLGSIGLDPNLGFPRWTFGDSHFYEGISLAIIGLGIFAVPELISLTVNRGKISQVPISKNLFRGQLQGAKDVIKHPGVFLSTSALGTIIGVIPGIGNAVVDWLAYGLTVQMAKNKEGFGKGDVRAIIGIDGSNNATTGGGLIPTLGFGIPGSTSMAFLLIVMFAHGISVGSTLLTEPSGQTLIYFMIWGIVVANIVGALICFLTAGYLVKVTTLPFYYMFALLIPIMFIAAYYDKNSVYDIFILLVLSLLGYIFKQMGWPRPPLLLGIVLSRSVEANLVISQSVFGMSWIYRPIVLVLWVIIFVGLFWSIKSSKILKSVKQDNDQDPSVPRLAVEVSQLKTTIFQRFKESGSILTVFLVVVLLAGLVSVFSWPKSAAQFPMVISIAVLIFLFLQLFKDLRSKQQAKGGLNFDVSPDLLGTPGEATRRALVSFGWILGLLITAIAIGLFAALPIFALLYLKIVGKVRWITSVVLTALLVLINIGFADLAGIYWNRGVLISFLFS